MEQEMKLQCGFDIGYIYTSPLSPSAPSPYVLLRQRRRYSHPIPHLPLSLHAPHELESGISSAIHPTQSGDELLRRAL